MRITSSEGRRPWIEFRGLAPWLGLMAWLLLPSVGLPETNPGGWNATGLASQSRWDPALSVGEQTLARSAHGELEKALENELLGRIAAVVQEQEPQEEAFTLDLDEKPEESMSQPATFADRLGDLLTENLRVNLDFITRVKYSNNRGGRFEALTALGLDVRKVISGRGGDIGVLVLQPYVVRRDNAMPIPSHTEDDDDVELEFHDFYFNLTRWGRGRRNIKIGHFDIPYGLEPNTDTHFTLHQLMPVQNLGSKKDWGVSLNGAFPLFDYEVALTRGSGFEYHNIGGRNFAFAGRIGTPSDSNFFAGLSGFYGKVFSPHSIAHWRGGIDAMPPLGNASEESLSGDELIERSRVGIDATWIVNQFTLKAEASGGQDFNQEVRNALAEVNWANPEETFSAYVQGTYRGLGGDLPWDKDIFARVGADWAINDTISVGAQFARRISGLGSHQSDNVFLLQFRYLLKIR